MESKTPPPIGEIVENLKVLRPDVADSEILVPWAQKIQKSWQLEPSPQGFSLPFSKRRVLNGTGIILHTNLGRAPLGKKIAQRIGQLLEGYINLEIDLGNGRRGSRHLYAEYLLKALNPHYDYVLVNNNAASVFLILRALHQRDKVCHAILSRGESVEIGGGFRIPEIILEAGIQLMEVGTTNKTYAADYEKALLKHPEPAVLLKVSASNFSMQGFVQTVSVFELLEIQKKFSQSRLVYDAGSLSSDELRNFPAGAQAVLFSADKLLGGPQMGIIACAPGVKNLLETHPLYRTYRVDKISLAALEATLEIHVAKKDRTSLPVIQMLQLSEMDLRQRFEDLEKTVTPKAFQWNLVPSESSLGGGSWKGELIPSKAIKIESAAANAEQILSFLRQAPHPVVGYIRGGNVLIDLRCLTKDEMLLLKESLLFLDERLKEKMYATPQI